MPSSTPDELIKQLVHARERAAAAVESALARHDLSVSKYAALSLLAQAEGRRLPLSVLAKRLRCAKSNVTGLVNRLEADGLVRRVVDPRDRRRSLAELTEDGARRLSAATPEHKAALADTVGELSLAERKDLLRLLQKLSREPSSQ